MKKNKLKRICAVALTLALGMSVFAGCGNKDAAAEGQTLVFNLGEDPKTIDPSLNESVGGSTIINNAFEGLLRLDENEKAVPGVAEKFEVSDDQLVYTFTLREDAKWSDGEPVTANDFKYSWLRALNPDTASTYAYQLFYLKNGEKYNQGEATAEEVGIEVVDDRTLVVTLEAPTAYFPQLMAFPTYAPLREDIVSANSDWANNPETYVSNGPFKLVEWTMKDQLVFEKNENYWNKDVVKLDSLVMKMVEDETTAYASLKAGNFDMVDKVPTNEIEAGQEEGLVTIYPNLGTYFVVLNVGKQGTMSEDAKKALNNKNVRKALNLAIDRKALVENVTKGGQIPAYSFVPQGIYNEAGEDFASKEYYDANVANIQEAKKLLAEAGYPNGEGLPTLSYMFNTLDSHKSIAQVLQQDWAQIGVNVELSNQEWKVFQTTRNEGQYEIARHGWLADYQDPMSFLDMWASNSGMNDAGFNNAEYDSLIAQAKVEEDAAKRWELMRAAEDILMEEMPVIPLYYYTSVKASNSNVKDVYVSSLGHVNFINAYLE